MLERPGFEGSEAQATPVVGTIDEFMKLLSRRQRGDMLHVLDSVGRNHEEDVVRVLRSLGLAAVGLRHRRCRWTLRCCLGTSRDAAAARCHEDTEPDAQG